MPFVTILGRFAFRGRARGLQPCCFLHLVMVAGASARKNARVGSAGKKDVGEGASKLRPE